MTLVNQFVVAITALHVLAHSVFGCCGHDMHGGAKTAAEHHCNHPGTDTSEANPYQHSHADAATVSHDANRASSFPLVDEAPAPLDRHQCRHADCHWQTGETCPDIQLLSFCAKAAILSTAPIEHKHDGSICLTFENDVGPDCALRLRLQFMSGVLQI
jgi:hypothetical protein